jgi:hypothetical protein
MAFRFSYLPLWKEIMSIVSREGRGMATCSEHVLSELLTALVDFLHGARQFIRTDGKTHHNLFTINSRVVSSTSLL